MVRHMIIEIKKEGKIFLKWNFKVKWIKHEYFHYVRVKILKRKLIIKNIYQ